MVRDCGRCCKSTNNNERNGGDIYSRRGLRGERSWKNFIRKLQFRLFLEKSVNGAHRGPKGSILLRIVLAVTYRNAYSTTK